MEKAGEEKGVCGGVWECGKPERFSIISMPRSRGKGRGGFLFKPPKGALFGSPFPPIVFRGGGGGGRGVFFFPYGPGGGLFFSPPPPPLSFSAVLRGVVDV